MANKKKLNSGHVLNREDQRKSSQKKKKKNSGSTNILVEKLTYKLISMKLLHVC